VNRLVFMGEASFLAHLNRKTSTFKRSPEWGSGHFHSQSHGGVPQTSHLQGVLQIVEYGQDGYGHLAKIDIKRCYPRINRRRLKQRLLSLGCLTPQFIKMILNWVSAPIYHADTDTLEYPKNGLHTGCPLSNLLLNIFLTPLDEFCEKLGVKFVRVYDDIFIVCKSEAKAKQAFKQVQKFIEKQLDLQLHPTKSKVRSVFGTRLLGFTLRNRRDKVIIIPNINNLERFKNENLSKLIEAFKTNKNICSFRYKLNEKTIGFANNYQIIDDYTRLKELDIWILKTTLLTIASTYKTRRDRLKAFKAILTNKSRAHQLASKQPEHVKKFLEAHLEEHGSFKFGTKLVSTYAVATKRKFQSLPLR
jgi:RNA-directed DNA polymerase